MKNNAVFNLSIILLLTCFTLAAYPSDAPRIDEKTAEKLIQAHIGDVYNHIQTGSVWGFNYSTVRFYALLEEAGLVTFKLVQKKELSSIERAIATEGTLMTIKLTEKGKRETIRCKTGEVGVLYGNRKIEKIVSISDNNTVLFSYLYTPNDLARRVGDKKSKDRGKAEFTYDPFLETYIFKNFWTSPWEKEDWSEAHWTYKDGNETVCKWR